MVGCSFANVSKVEVAGLKVSGESGNSPLFTPAPGDLESVGNGEGSAEKAGEMDGAIGERHSVKQVPILLGAIPRPTEPTVA